MSVSIGLEGVGRLALHACCAPCLLEPYDAFADEGIKVVVVYYNPNIHPVAEYERRRDTLEEHARSVGMLVEELVYDPASWVGSVAESARTPAERCRKCYRLRLREVARWAAEHGCDAVATTLTVSPYQDQEALTAEGVAACAEAGVRYVECDFRDRFGEATRRSRELRMYRQNYCGCLLSDLEATAQRAERRERRHASRDGG